MFDNIDKKVLKTPRQKIKEGKVVKAKAGRKPQPNMKKFLFSMDINLHTRLTSHAKDIGTNKSSIVNRLVSRYLSEVDRERFKEDIAKRMIEEGLEDSLISKITDIPISRIKMY